MKKAFLGIVVSMMCALSVRDVRAVDDPPAVAPRLLYFRCRASRPLDDKLIQYLSAHLSPTFEIRVIEKKSAFDLPAGKQISALRALIEARHASAAAWLSPDGKSVNVLAPELSSSPWSIVVPVEKTGSNNWCESMAVLLKSDIAALLPAPQPPPSSTPSTASAATGGDSAPPVDRAPSKKEKTDLVVTKSKSASRRAVPVWIGSAVGYAPTWQISKRGPLHGVHAELDVGVGKHFRISFQGLMAQRTDFVVADRNVALRRWPVRVLLHGALPLNRFVLTVGLGGVWAPTYLRDLPHSPENSATDQVQHPWGGSMQISVDYWVLRWLGILLKSGIDVFVDEVRLTYEDDTVLHVNRVGGSLFVGVTGRVFLRGDS